MKSYDITVRAIITKTLRVEANTQDEAVEIAHDLFDLHYEDDIPEDYDEETLEIKEVEDKEAS